MEPLSFEEWREQICVTVPPEIAAELRRTLGIDADQEIEKAIRNDYAWYVAECNKEEQ